MRKCRSASLRLLASTALLASALGPPAAAAEERQMPSALLLIFDASGSMWGQIKGENKIVIARRVLGSLIDELPADTELGVIAYGHRREGDCDDIETVVPLAALDKTAIKATVDGLNPKGKTPITRSLQQAFGALRGRAKGVAGATVILVSDGLETCGGDPCAAVRDAKKQGLDFILHVVGFDVAGEDVSQLECAAQAGEGMFMSAEDADGLFAALDAAVTTPEVPDGRLSVKAIADGELQDASLVVRDSATGADANHGRTYADPSTNPRVLPLADGRYAVEVKALRINGDTTRRFEIEISGGSTVVKEVNFSTGEVSIGVTRNGELSDSTYTLYVTGSKDSVDTGRTYTKAKSNPAVVRITAGTYDVLVRSLEISGHPEHRFDGVTVEPGARAELAHAFVSGALRIGASRRGELVDATISVIDIATGREVAKGRTYTKPKSNPKTFTLDPGRYRIKLKALRVDGTPKQTFELELEAGGAIERIVEF